MESNETEHQAEDKTLWDVISKIFKTLEDDEDIVICSTNESVLAKKMYNAVLGVVPKTNLTDIELHGVRLLILEAIANKSFFDWEMPTLTGFTSDQFEEIAAKLPRE